jgi:hypothetical protein
MTHIIISYRRADSDAISGRIRDRLANHFGDDSIFMDIDSIPFGVDFREHIQEALAQNDILIAIIGPKWLGPGRGDRMRIMEETDPVRIEIETALKNRSAIIPVLVGDAGMPEPTELPDSLKDLAFRNAAQVEAGRDFNQHMERLIRSIEFILSARGKAKGAAAETVPPPADVAPIVSPPMSEPVPTPKPAAVIPAAVFAAAAIPAATAANAAVPPPPPYTAPPPPIPPSPSRLPWIAAGFGTICLMAAVAGGTWYLTRSGSQDATPKPAAKTTAEPPDIARTLPKTMPAVAAGCKLSVPALLADDFRVVDPSWSLPAQIAYYADGQLVMKGMEGKISRVLYPPYRFKNPTICATVQAPMELNALDGLTNGGVMFWATDASNFYVASVYANGTYSIFRMANDAWASVAARAPADSIRSGIGAVNEVMVSTKDSTGTLFVNGVKITEFRGQPPKDGSVVGLYGASSVDERNEWRARYVAAGDPDEPAPAPPPARALAPQVTAGCKPSRPASFSDTFRTSDPGWGISANTPASIADGQFLIKPTINKAWQQLYASLFFKSATICVQIKSPPQAADLDGNLNAGLAFWAVNRSNYYTADIHPNGRFAVYRMVNDQWATVVSPRKMDAVKAGFNATNELMVTFSGDRAVFFINGQKAGEFRGQPPRTGGSIGLFAASEVNGENEWRFSNLVVVESE